MYSHKGVPNRWRVDRYRETLTRLPVTVSRLEPTDHTAASEVHAVRPVLAHPFRYVNDDDLAWLALRLATSKVGYPQLGRAGITLIVSPD